MTEFDSQQFANALVQGALDGKAEQVVLLDVRQLTFLADYFLICNGTSDRHARSVAQHIKDAGDETGMRLNHREGETEARWILLDWGDVVVHVFDAPTREFYRLEELWADAPRVVVDLVA